MMNKKVLHVITLGVIVLFAILAVASMESTPSSYSSGGGYSSGSSSGGASSSSSDTGKSYTVINKSSYDVTLSDSSGSITIKSGQTSFVRFNDPVSSVRYLPDDKVSAGLSGDYLVFTDK